MESEPLSGLWRQKDGVSNVAEELKDLREKTWKQTNKQKPNLENSDWNCRKWSPIYFTSPKMQASLMQNSGVKCDESASRHASFPPRGCLNVRFTQINSFFSFQIQLRIIFKHLSQNGCSACHWYIFSLLGSSLWSWKHDYKQSRKSLQFWVILNSKNPFQLFIWPSSRPPSASHQLSCKLAFHRASTQGDFSGQTLKLPCQVVTPRPCLGLDSSLHGLSLFNMVSMTNMDFWFLGWVIFWGGGRFS